DSPKRKFVLEESESESSYKSVRTSEEPSLRKLGSKGGTAKRLKSSSVKGRTSSKLPTRSFDEASVAEEVGGVRRTERTVETQHELTREFIASEIRAQVLQSVHSLSSSEDSGSLVLPERESEIVVVEPVSSVVSIEELASVEPTSVVEGALAVEVTCVLSSEASVEASLGEPEVLASFVEPSALLEEQLTVAVPPAVPSSSAEEPGFQVRANEACGVCGEVGPHSCTSRVFSCSSCNKSFSSRFKLSRHQLIHGSERHYRCHICDRSFHRKDHLKNHLQIHKPTKQFKCEREDCGKEYNSYMSYRKHCAFHSAEEGDLQCKFCSKMFVNKNDLIYHLKVHVGTRTVKNPSEKKFQCDQCDRRFFTRKDVKRHLVVHTGTRDFCCSLCPQKFGRKDHLVRHIKKSHGVTDLTRLETLADPLAVPGPSGIASTSSIPPLSPGLSSISTSSGETTGLPAYMLPSSPTPQQSIPSPEPGSSQDPGSSLPSYQEVGTPSFSGFIGDPSADMRILVGDTIKEEHDLTASVAGLGPDLSNILGLYLPSSEGINMTSIMDTSSTTSIVTTHLQEVSTLPPPPPYSASHFQPMSPLPPHPFSSQPTSPTPPEEMERLLPGVTDTSTSTSTTTSTTTSSST
ncbi:Zinc finger C2H2-type, partial [Trinorchestia longiramus]